MADEKLVIEIDADTTGLIPTIDLLEKLGKVDAATAEQFRKATAAFQGQKKAFEESNPAIAKNTEALNKLADTLEKKAKPAIEKTDKSFNSFISTVKNVAGAIGIGLGVQQLISFGNNAIDAFAKAEKAVIQLGNALNGNSEAQKRLINQATQLQDKLGVDDDTIIQQQAFLALQGRTESQITKTIQAAIQLSAVTGEDLQTAVQKLDATFEGQLGRLGKLDSRFNELTDTQLANGAAIDLINEKYKGFAEAGAASVSGQLEIQKRRVEELSEDIGSVLAPAWINAKEAALEYITTSLAALGLGKTEDEKQLERSKKAIAALTEKQFAQKTAAEIESELTKQSIALNELNQKKQTLDVKIEKELLKERIDTLTSLWEQRLKVTSAGVEAEIETLENLRKKKAELEKEQGKVADPLGVGKTQSQKLLAEITAIQVKIDEITGKAAEERRKKAQDIAAKAAKDAEDIQRKSFEVARDEWEKLQKDKLDLELRGYRVAEDEFEQSEKNKRDLQRKSFEVARDEYEQFVEDEIKKQKEAEEKRRENIQATLETLVALSSEIGQIFANADQAQLDSLAARREALEESFDAESQLLQDKLDRDQITQAEFDIQMKELRKKEEDDKKRIAAEERKIKREAAEREKQLAIFQIIVDTARAIASSLPNLFLSALAGVLGAAQLAKVISTPLPKFHTGKLAKTDSSEQHAIVRNDETIFDPSKSKAFNKTFEAIYYNKIPAKVLNDFVQLRLNNVSHTGKETFVGADEYAIGRALGRGTNIKNTDELGKSIAKHLSGNINPRTKI